MKKSNKLLLVLMGAVLVAVFVLSVTLRTDADINSADNHVFQALRKVPNSKTITGNGHLISEVKTLANFKTITADGKYNLKIQTGKNNQVTLQTDDNIMPYMVMNVVNGNLKLATKPNVNVNVNSQIRAAITNKDSLNTIILNGKNNLQAEQLESDLLKVIFAGDNIGHLKGKVKTLDLNLGGKSTLYVNDLQGQNINLNIAGNGTVDLSGHVANLTIITHGAAVVNAKNLKVNNVRIAGAGKTIATVNASKTISITTFGEAIVTYYGHPNISKRAFGKIILKPQA